MSTCHHVRFRALGSPCQLHLYGDAVRVQQTVVRVRDWLRTFEQTYSRFRTDSLLARINDHAGSDWVCDDTTAALIQYGHALWEQSDGLFDLTSGVLSRCWDFHGHQLPDPGRLREALSRCGWAHVRWAPPVLHMPEGFALDFGGIGKEYAVDVVVNLCREQGIEHGLVDFGGDIGVIGPHPDGTAWRIGIRHPRQPDRPCLHLELEAGAIATSGDYERYLEVEGVRYCHILNPKTGWPPSTWASMTVIAGSCLIAGSLATVAMLREADAPGWLNDTGLPWLGIRPDLSRAGPLADQSSR
ncbi:FAD:protein FMN transferase [Hahella sp. SMD15-11]|uniref:FAD:protein FMN transferase n=1 Tax=Thermohahella caldifontis TaxID=3142973 RepID=A0AB39UUI6_9GAMM